MYSRKSSFNILLLMHYFIFCFCIEDTYCGIDSTMTSDKLKTENYNFCFSFKVGIAGYNVAETYDKTFLFPYLSENFLDRIYDTKYANVISFNLDIKVYEMVWFRGDVMMPLTSEKIEWNEMAIYPFEENYNFNHIGKIKYAIFSGILLRPYFDKFYVTAFAGLGYLQGMLNAPADAGNHVECKGSGWGSKISAGIGYFIWRNFSIEFNIAQRNIKLDHLEDDEGWIPVYEKTVEYESYGFAKEPLDEGQEKIHLDFSGIQYSIGIVIHF